MNELKEGKLIPGDILVNIYAVIGLAHCSGRPLEICCKELFDHGLIKAERKTLERLFPEQ